MSAPDVEQLISDKTEAARSHDDDDSTARKRRLRFSLELV